MLEPISGHCTFVLYFEESALPQIDTSSCSGYCVFHAYATCNVIRKSAVDGCERADGGYKQRYKIMSSRSKAFIHSIWKSSNTAHADLAPKPQHLSAIVAREGPARLPISGTHLRIRGYLERGAPRVCLSSFVSIQPCTHA